MFAILKKNQNIFLLLVATIISTSVFAESNRSCKKKVICADTVKAKTICADELVVKTGCCASYTITAKDFMDADGNLSQTFVISEPGKYSLGENINFAPADDAFLLPAIQILASDVHLDLCSNTLRQVNNVLDIIGVQIGEGYFYNDPDNVLKNITIINGTITQFSAMGVFCYNGSFDGGAGELAFESLRLTDLNILECGSHPSFDSASGINFDSLASSNLIELETPVAYKNIIINNCKVNRCIGNIGLVVYTADNIITNQTQVNDFTTEISILGLAGAYYITARNMQLNNCQGNGTTDLDETNFIGQVGSFFQQCLNVYIKDCQFNDTYGAADLLINTNFSYTVNGICENCQFNNARGGDLSSLVCGMHVSDGIDLPDATKEFKFINCQFNGTRRSALGTGGANIHPNQNTGVIMITSRNITFDSCQAVNILTDNPLFNSAGFFISTGLRQVSPEAGNTQNITFRNSIVSDIFAPLSSIGFYCPGLSGSYTGIQGELSNFVFENCIAERIHSNSSAEIVAGIAQNPIQYVPGPSPRISNTFIRGCRISDIRSNSVQPSVLSAGILLDSVKQPVIIDSSISDCDRGILLTGTSSIPSQAESIFQIAATLEEALAFPPVFIDLDVILTLTTDQAGLGPFTVVYAQYAPRNFTSISAMGALTDPINACTPLVTPITGKIGVSFAGECGNPDGSPGTNTINVENAGGVASIIVQSSFDYPPYALESKMPIGTIPTFIIGPAEGNELINALSNNPNITLTISSIPAAPPFQAFENIVRGNAVDFTPADVDSQRNWIYSSSDLNELGWQSGDPIFYNCNGGDPISDLICSTTYYAIVYRPGFAENGVILNNSVDNCSVSGYADDRTPNTNSAWVNNFAFNNGMPASELTNYDIAWSGTAPVYAGDLADYPTGSAKAYNISLIQ